MAAETTQQQLSGEVIPQHLTTNPDSRVAPDLEVEAAKGLFYCTDCDRRITRNTQNYNEYGHDRTCDHHQTAGVVWQ